MVAAMRPGSVIVDLAAEMGGNCELTEPGQEVIREGVIIIGTLNLPATVPVHASQMFSNNIKTLLLHLMKDKELQLDMEDEITGAMAVTHAGAIVHQATRDALQDGA